MAGDYRLSPSNLQFILALVFCLTTALEAKYSGGDGSLENPYQIASANDLNDIGNNIEDFNKAFILTADINLAMFTGSAFRIIGIWPDSPFAGTFDGAGHSISSFSYTCSVGDKVGLFTCVDGSSAQISDLRLVNPRIEAETSDFVGALVGYLARGTVANCSAESAYVSGRGDFPAGIGGLVGLSAEAQVVQCHFTGNVQGVTRVGGLVGTNNGVVIECFTSGQVTADYSSAGGLIGGQAVPAAMALNCYSNCEVSGYRWIGGLVGANDDGWVSSCYSTGNVQGTIVVGGLIGGRVVGETEYSVWDVNTSGQWDSAGGEGRTTEEMHVMETFTAIGWDFMWETIDGVNDVWMICNGVDYPKLAWQYTIGDSDSNASVDFVDFAAMGLKWMSHDDSFYCGMDLTGDEWVDLDDLVVFAENWLQ